MCGRVVQASDPLRFAIVDGLNVPDSRAKPPSYNAAPRQLLYVIRENHETGERVLGLLRWGRIPHGCGDPDGGRKPINARAETVAQLPTFRAAYAKRRCIVPCLLFFRVARDQRRTREAALRRGDERPHAVRYRRPVGELAPPAKRRVDSHLRYSHRAGEQLVAEILDRMPLILPKVAYERWLGREPDPHDLLVPFPADQMAMWPVSTRVNKPENDDASLLDPAA